MFFRNYKNSKGDERAIINFFKYQFGYDVEAAILSESSFSCRNGNMRIRFKTKNDKNNFINFIKENHKLTPYIDDAYDTSSEDFKRYKTPYLNIDLTENITTSTETKFIYGRRIYNFLSYWEYSDPIEAAKQYEQYYKYELKWYNRYKTGEYEGDQELIENYEDLLENFDKLIRVVFHYYNFCNAVDHCNIFRPDKTMKKFNLHEMKENDYGKMISICKYPFFQETYNNDYFNNLKLISFNHKTPINLMQ